MLRKTLTHYEECVYELRRNPSVQILCVREGDVQQKKKKEAREICPAQLAIKNDKVYKL